MQVGWFIPQDERLASYRLRCKIPSEQLSRLNVKSHFGIGDVTIVSKHWVPLEEVEKIEGRLIFDICDDHFGSAHDSYYRRVIELADLVVCSTNRMAERIAIETGVMAKVITDPYEYSKAGPQMPSGTVKNVFWFGHPSNLISIRRELPRLGGYNLKMISEAPGCIPWSHREMLECFTWCDVVIIPVENKEKKMVKSPNRMVDSIRNGRYVIANPMPAYEGYGMWLGDIVEGLKWAADNVESSLESVRIAQAIIEEKHSPEAVALLWKEAIESVC